MFVVKPENHLSVSVSSGGMKEWKITEGNRPLQNENITDEMYEIICKSWKQNPKERLTINQIIEKLEKLI